MKLYEGSIRILAVPKVTRLRAGWIRPGIEKDTTQAVKTLPTSIKGKRKPRAEAPCIPPTENRSRLLVIIPRQAWLLCGFPAPDCCV
eukprot:scaffold70963_cov20-Tisochrysis_lutea.AAC.4